MEYEREVGVPRPERTYRWWRRNNSILNRDTKNWLGTDARYVGHPKIEEKIAKKQIRDQARKAAKESQG